MRSRRIERFDMENGKTLEVPGRDDHLPREHLRDQPGYHERRHPRSKTDMVKQVDFFKEIGKHLEAKRLEERVNYDLEMMRELGYCSGIENYSRYFDRRQHRAAPLLPAGLLPGGFPDGDRREPRDGEPGAAPCTAATAAARRTWWNTASGCPAPWTTVR
jgi:hypothetical protein